MRFRFGFAVGFGVGYVLGTKAGHEQYEKMMAATRQFWDSDAGKQVKGIADQVGAVATEAVGAVKQRAGAASEEPPLGGDGSNGKI